MRLCVYVGTCAILAVIPVQTLVQTDGQPTFSGNLATRRNKRWISILAKVVKDATLVKSRKNYDLFLKRGGIKQARKDFRLFRPTETGDTGDFGKYGIGDGYSVFVKYPNRGRKETTLSIESIVKQADGKTLLKKRIVIYKQ